MAADQKTNDAFLVTETASGTKIEILTHPDFPLGSFLRKLWQSLKTGLKNRPFDRFRLWLKAFTNFLNSINHIEM